MKATDEHNNERAITAGKEVLRRTWNNDTHIYDYWPVGIVTSTSDETFTYGTTNTDYGTTGIKDPYSVPKSLIVEIYDTEREEARSLEATFAGYNMQLWSKHAYLDADAAGSYEAAKVMMTDSKQRTTMAFIGESPGRNVDHNWESSCIRGFLNGESNLSGYLWTNIQEEAGDPGKPEEYEIKHTFI